jgi:putative PIN family toxin of toxin-antitoxin system
MIWAVIDINVLVSSILGPLGFSRQIILAWEAGRFTAVSSEGMITTLEEKLALPRISKRYNLRSLDDIEWVRGLLRTQTELILVPTDEVRPVMGDPEDDLVLATGRLAQAHYLVTGDRGLLDLDHYEGMQILRPRDFLNLLEPQANEYL